MASHNHYGGDEPGAGSGAPSQQLAAAVAFLAVSIFTLAAVLVGMERSRHKRSLYVHDSHNPAASLGASAGDSRGCGGAADVAARVKPAARRLPSARVPVDGEAVGGGIDRTAGTGSRVVVISPPPSLAVARQRLRTDDTIVVVGVNAGAIVGVDNDGTVSTSTGNNNNDSSSSNSNNNSSSSNNNNSLRRNRSASSSREPLLRESIGTRTPAINNRSSNSSNNPVRTNWPADGADCSDTGRAESQPQPHRMTDARGRRLELLVHNVSHKDLVLSLRRTRHPAAASKVPAADRQESGEDDDDGSEGTGLDAVRASLFALAFFGSFAQQGCSSA